MEIHASHGTVHSWREMAKQLAIITAGMLQEWKAQIGFMRTALFLQEQVGLQLQTRYRAVLEGR
jgi:hypothetical protein